eukprot:scaffold28342_cov53-Cyclotella_meneghiniana.AAC.2
MLNGDTWLRLEFIVCSDHNRLTFDEEVVTISASVPNFSHPDCVHLDHNIHITAASLFQCLIICMLNGYKWLRLEFIIYRDHNTLTFDEEVVTISASAPNFSHPNCVHLDHNIHITAA